MLSRVKTYDINGSKKLKYKLYNFLLYYNVYEKLF